MNYLDQVSKYQPIRSNTLRMLQLINSGKIFWVEFLKKDGTIRTMRARTKVKSYLQGGKLKYNPANYNLISVFDMDKREYRSFTLHKVIELHAGGHIFY